MMKRYLVGVLAVLLLAAIASWGWYFATRPPQNSGDGNATFSIRPMPRQQTAPHWRAASAKERASAIASVVAQLDAFKADDYKRAAKYQSRGLRRNFSSVENFRGVIQGSYPQFADYKKAKFGKARASEDGFIVEIPIELTGNDGVMVRAQYSLVLEDKLYRVAGVSGGSGTGQKSSPPSPPGFEKVAPLLT